MDEIIPANDVQFGEICSMLEKVSQCKKKRQDQERILANFFDNFRLNAAKIDSRKNVSIYPILRLLLPSLERERSAYNLKETKLGSLLVKVLSLSKDSRDAQSLEKYRSVNNSQENDFAGVAYYVLKKREKKNPESFTVEQINDLLDKVATAEVGNKAPILDTVFSCVIKRLSAEQCKWFLRIVLKDMKLGVGVNRILAAFHPDAPEHYENLGNLSKVCEELNDGNARPIEMGIQLFYAVSPMLSERLNVTQVCNLPPDKTYQIEEKFDGERFQIHMENGIFEYYSRKGFSFANQYGRNYDSGLLTPYLKDLFSPSVTSFVLDGEMMGWHKQYQCLGSKGMAFDIKKVTENSKFQPCFCAFDVLYYNGKSLVGPPENGGVKLSERLQLLDSMFTHTPGVIHHSTRETMTKSSDIVDALNKAIENQDEGIVVKDTDSYYIANRRNAGWYKIKPEYTEGTMSDLDLVIIGADEAESKRQGRAKSFYVACADAAPGEAARRWVCVGCVAGGLTHEERGRVCAALERNWMRLATASPPDCLVFNRDKPDFWIMPEHSLVLQVRASELVRSSRSGAQYTLRFPRVMRTRADKPVRDIMTLDEYYALVPNKEPVVKLSTKRINEDQMGATEAKRKSKRSGAPQVAERFRVRSEGSVAVTSRALLARRLCVLSGDEESSSEALARIAQAHGAILVANSGPTTWCCIAGRVTPRVQLAVTSRSADVFPSSWLRALPPSDTPLPLPVPPLSALSLRPQTELSLARHYDRYGDSYVEATDKDELQMCFAKMDKEEPEIYLTNQEMLNIDELLFEDGNPFSYLRPCRLHLFDIKDLIALKAKMYGATLCELDAANLTHVVASRMSSDQMEEVKQKTEARIVSEDWLQACFVENKLVSEYNFKL